MIPSLAALEMAVFYDDEEPLSFDEIAIPVFENLEQFKCWKSQQKI